ncbi:MAG: hypothetical protein ACK55I_37720, partial [bacterium]
SFFNEFAVDLRLAHTRHIKVGNILQQLAELVSALGSIEQIAEGGCQLSPPFEQVEVIVWF